MAKYTNEQLISMCGDHIELFDIKTLLMYYLSFNKILKNFEDYVKCLMLQKKADKKIRSIYKILINNIGLELLKMINDILDDYTCWPLYINTGNDKFLKLFVNWLEKVKAMRG